MGFVELVDLLDIGAGVAEVREVVVPLVADGVQGRHERLDIGGVDGGVDKRGFEETVDVVLGGVAVGIGPDPAVVLDRDVEGLGAVADVVGRASRRKRGWRLRRVSCPGAPRRGCDSRAWRT